MALHILCIDDYDVRGLRCAVLGRAGYLATAALSSSAVTQLQQGSFDAVIINSDLSCAVAEQIMDSIHKDTRVLKLDRGIAGQDLVTAVHDLLAGNTQENQ